jgi:hypothetical protein
MSDRDEGAGENVPSGVDPALWAEFQALSEEIHVLHRARRGREEGEPEPATRRVVLDLPEEWFLFAAWLDMRTRQRIHGKDGPTGHLSLRESLGMRPTVRGYILHALDNHFHEELHELCTGISSLLRPRPERPKEEKRPLSDLDDDIPF